MPWCRFKMLAHDVSQSHSNLCTSHLCPTSNSPAHPAQPKTSFKFKMALGISIRDRISRLLTFNHEVKRKSLLLIIKNRENVDFMSRMKAQLELQKMKRHTRPSALVRRCIEGGRSRVSRIGSQEILDLAYCLTELYHVEGTRNFQAVSDCI